MKNKIYNAQKMQGRLHDPGDFPKVVLIDTVSMCNLKCSMCVHQHMKRKKGVMKWDLFKKIVDEIACENKNTRVWMVFFGDPYVIKNKKPSIFDLIKYAKDKGLSDVVLNTNANLMDREAARRTIEAGLDALYIGIDAFTPDTYAKLRVGGDYDKVVRNVVALLEMKKKLMKDKPRVFVQFVEMDVNKSEKEQFIKFWNEQGAEVKIRPKISWAGMIDAPNLVLGDKDRWPCYWAMQTMSVTDTGKVVTCAVDLDAKFIAGDITTHSLRDVWNGALKELRQFHLQRQFEKLPDNCRNCRDWQSARADYYAING